MIPKLVAGWVPKFTHLSQNHPPQSPAMSVQHKQNPARDTVSSSVKHAGPHPPRLIMRPQTTHASRSSSGEKGSRHPRHAAFPLLPFLPLVPLATTRSPATPCMGAASAGPPRVRRAAGAMEPRAPGQALSFPRPVVRVDRLLIELN